MTGRRRRANTFVWNLRPGDYMIRFGRLWIRLPDGSGPFRLDDRWTVTVNPDRTVTVTPSIHDTAGGWHGWLTAGVWSTA